jgi:hypothetical protein
MDMHGGGPAMPPAEFREIVETCRRAAFGTP